MLKVIDKKNYKKFKGRKLKTVYKYDKQEWRCTTPRGALVRVVYKGGIVALTGGNCEYDLGKRIFLLGSTVDYEEDFEDEDLDYNLLTKKNKYPKISFQDIMDFMEWECEEENIWDIYVG